MPNIKSAKKRVLVAKAANDINKANKSLLKTNVKKFEVAAALSDPSHPCGLPRCMTSMPWMWIPVR